MYCNVLLGPTASLSSVTLDNLNLSGVDLSDAILDDVRGVNLEQCPSALIHRSGIALTRTLLDQEQTYQD